MCQQKTLSELRQLKIEKDEEDKRRDLSISLGFCPICGCRIIRQNLEILNPPKKYLFGLITKRTKIWDYRTFCSKDKSHYEYKEDYYDDFYEY